MKLAPATLWVGARRALDIDPAQFGGFIQRGLSAEATVAASFCFSKTYIN
jgi:hypothetical protein